MQKKVLVILSSVITFNYAMAEASDNLNLENSFNGKFSGNFAVVSDYKFRGISQTMQSPASQGTIEFLHNSGVKLGFSGSNVDFGSGADASLEGDIYTSYNTSFSNLSSETGVIYYSYPGTKSSNNYNYTELYENLGYDFGKVQLGLSFYYSPEFFAESGKAYYPRLSLTIPLNKSFSLDGWVGRQWIENNSKYGVPDYTDYEIGLTYKIDSFAIKTSYVDTNLNSKQCLNDLCAKEVLISVSKSF